MKKLFEKKWKEYNDSCDQNYGVGDPYFLAEFFYEAGIKAQQESSK